MLPKQFKATIIGKIWAAKPLPNTCWKNRTATSCPELLISSFGTAATYATLTKKKRHVTKSSERRPALRTVRTGSDVRTSPKTLNALYHPENAKLVFTRAVAKEPGLVVLPLKGERKLANGSRTRVKPPNTRTPVKIKLNGQCEIGQYMKD
jgi:hypothetical protein